MALNDSKSSEPSETQEKTCVQSSESLASELNPPPHTDTHADVWTCTCSPPAPADVSLPQRQNSSTCPSITPCFLNTAPNRACKTALAGPPAPLFGRPHSGPLMGIAGRPRPASCWIHLCLLLHGTRCEPRAPWGENLPGNFHKYEQCASFPLW